MVQVTWITEGWHDGDDVKLAAIWDVARKVGPNGDNWRSDVMLVQVMLRDLYSDPRMGRGWWDGMRPLNPDGRFGPITRGWIRGFQSGPAFGQLLHRDGAVSRSRGMARYDGAGGEKMFTIYALNAANDMRVASGDYISDLPSDPDTPAYLSHRLIRALEQSRMPANYPAYRIISGTSPNRPIGV